MNVWQCITTAIVFIAVLLMTTGGNIRITIRHRYPQPKKDETPGGGN